MEDNNDAVDFAQGDKFTSDFNGYTYEIAKVRGNKAKISSPQTGANWFPVEKIQSDIDDGVLK